MSYNFLSFPWITSIPVSSDTVTQKSRYVMLTCTSTPYWIVKSSETVSVPKGAFLRTACKTCLKVQNILQLCLQPPVKHFYLTRFTQWSYIIQDKPMVQNGRHPTCSSNNKKINNSQFKPKSISHLRFLKFLKDQRPIILLENSLFRKPRAVFPVQMLQQSSLTLM
jgi:hypothetical protein